MKPFVGAIVHFVMPNSAHRAAVVVAVSVDRKNIEVTVFTASGDGHQSVSFRTCPTREDAKEFAIGTWHWPEKEL